MSSVPGPVQPPSPERGACTRLLCASVWTPEGSAVEALLALRVELLRRCEGGAVRTALLYCGGWLVQWSEGPEAEVDAAWAAVQSDAACRYERVLHRSQGSRTLVEPVQIATLHAGERSTDVARRLYRLGREHEEGFVAEPAEIWQALSAPCQLARDGVSCIGRREVVAVTSEDNESVELLRGLAHDGGARVAYQRYAGADPRRGDVGAAYADLHTGEAVATRVHALSRRALSHSLARLGLRQLGGLFVLLGEHGPRTAALMNELVEVLRALDVAPAVHVVSSCPAARLAGLAIFSALPGVTVDALDASALGGAARATVGRVLGLAPFDLDAAGSDSLWHLPQTTQPVASHVWNSR